MTSKTPILCLCLLGAGFAQGQITPSADGYLFRLKLAKGMGVEWGVQMGVHIGAGKNSSPAIVKGPLVAKVTDVSKGVATVVYDLGPLSLGGNPVLARQSSTVRQNSSGRMIGGAEGQNPSMVDLPTKAVKVGGTWKGKATISGGVGQSGNNVEAVYKLEIIEKLDSVPVARISAKYTANKPSKIRGTGLLWISLSDGWLYKSALKFDIERNKTTMKTTVDVARKK